MSVGGAFSWSGGDIDVPLTLAGTGSVATGPANPAKFGNSGDLLLTVSGTLTFLGPGAASANALSSVELMFDSNITVAPGGRIDLADGARILSNRCCTGRPPPSSTRAPCARWAGPATSTSSASTSRGRSTSPPGPRSTRWADRCGCTAAR